jgi:hypothetical protein
MPIGINNVSPGDPFAALVRRVADLERLVRELTAAPSLQNTTLAQGNLNVAGGNITLNGGTFSSVDTTGQALFTVGPQLYGDRGVTINRADGSAALKVAKIFDASDTVQRIQIFDSVGAVIGGDAQLSPTGFDSPHIAHAWRPMTRADAVLLPSSVALNTWSSLFEHRGYRGNPGLPITFSVVCSDTTTAGHLQVIDTASGSPIAAFFAAPWLGSIPAGSTAEQFITSPPLSYPGTANTAQRLQIQAQRTAGTGTISVQIAQSVGGGL